VGVEKMLEAVTSAGESMLLVDIKEV